MRYSRSTFSLLLAIAAGSAFLGCASDRTILLREQRTTAFDLFTEGQFMESQGQFEAALNNYLKAQELSPRPVFAFKIGEVYHRQGALDQAIPRYEEAIAQSPDFEQAKAQLILAQDQKANQKPLAEIQESLASPGIARHMALTVSAESNTTTEFLDPVASQPLSETLGKEEIREAVFPELDATKLSAKELREEARKAESEGRWVDAITYYQELRKTDSSERILLPYATALSETGQLRRAQEILRENARNNQPTEAYYLTWAGLLSKGGLFGDAERVLLEGINRHGDSLKLKNNLGAVYLAQRRLEESQVVLEQLVSQHPDFLPAKYNLALCYLEKVEPTKAEPLLREYIQKKGDQASSAQNLLSNPQFFPQ